MSEFVTVIEINKSVKLLTTTINHSYFIQHQLEKNLYINDTNITHLDRRVFEINLNSLGIIFDLL